MESDSYMSGETASENMVYDNGSSSVIRNVSVKQTHGTYYSAPIQVRFYLIDYHVNTECHQII